MARFRNRPGTSMGERGPRNRYKGQASPSCTAIPTACVDRALGRRPRGQSDAVRAALQQDRLRRDDIIRRLIVEGSDRLACHVFHRHTADRRGTRWVEGAGVPSWAEIAEWAKLEALVDEADARLLASSPPETSVLKEAQAVGGSRGRSRQRASGERAPTRRRRASP